MELMWEKKEVLGYICGGYQQQRYLTKDWNVQWLSKITVGGIWKWEEEEAMG